MVVEVVVANDGRREEVEKKRPAVHSPDARPRVSVYAAAEGRRNRVTGFKMLASRFNELAFSEDGIPSTCLCIHGV